MEYATLIPEWIGDACGIAGAVCFWLCYRDCSRECREHEATIDSLRANTAANRAALLEAIGATSDSPDTPTAHLIHVLAKRDKDRFAEITNQCGTIRMLRENNKKAEQAIRARDEAAEALSAELADCQGKLEVATAAAQASARLGERQVKSIEQVSAENAGLRKTVERVTAENESLRAIAPKRDGKGRFAGKAASRRARAAGARHDTVTP